MEIMHIPTESDVKRWIKESLIEYFEKNPPVPCQPSITEEEFSNRKQAAASLGISLVTLHNWMNRGLPYHKQGGRVYFLRSEIHDFVKQQGRREDSSWTKRRYFSKPQY